MPRPWIRLFFLLLVCGLISAERFAAAEPPAGETSGVETRTTGKSAATTAALLPRPLAAMTLPDINGELQTIGRSKEPIVTVLVYVSTTCPVANSYTAELNRLSRRWPDQVKVYGVVADQKISRDQAATHFQKFGAEFPVLQDAAGLLADVLEPTHVPECFVLDRDRRLVYRGAIDNAYESIGRRRVAVERHYLRDAVAATIDGNRVDPARTEPIGCHFPKPLTPSPEATVTYHRDVAPILDSRCRTCHRSGQVAPFELTSYSEAVTHAAMIVEVTGRRIMPPWMPTPDAQPPLVGERWLSEAEIETLSQWLEEGCPEGKVEKARPEPQFTDGWQLGEPDMVVRMPESFSVPAEGPDILQNFVVPLDLAEDKMVAAIEFHPGNRRVVHHAVLFLDDSGQARRLDAESDEPGYENFGGPGFIPIGSLGGWSVGNTPRRLPNDMGRYLKRGSDLVVQVHYHPSGKPEIDQSEIGLYFVDRPTEELLAEPSKLVGSIWMANYEMDIPPGEAEYRRTTQYTLPRDVQLVGLIPHMHLLGKSMRVTATYPDGRQQTLIEVLQWDFNWQDEYYYREPISLPAGTQLHVEAVFDNSADNPSNPNSPPERVTYGEETTDEMLFCFFLLTAPKTEDLIYTIYHNLGHDLQQPRKDVSGGP